MQQRIAVVGSGMAGLAVAWICQRGGHDVTVFEAQNGRGMDAHTLGGVGKDGGGWVDVPLRVMSHHAWRTVLALCDELDLETFPVDAQVSYSLLDQQTWFRSGKINVGPFSLPSVGSWRYFHRNGWLIVRDLVKLVRQTNRLHNDDSSQYQQQSLEEFFRSGGYHPVFWRGFLLPILTTICTCREESLLKWPAKDLLHLMKNVMLSRQLRRLTGGTRSLVNQLAAELRFVSGSPVVQIAVHPEGVDLANAQGQGGRFDRVIFATQANQLGFLESQAFAQELALLDSFQFDAGELVVHTDRRFMPYHRRDWTSLNFQSDPTFQRSMFTVWVNPVEPSLADSAPIFQTWNPLFAPREDQLLCRVALQRAVVSRGNSEALRKLDRLHGEPGRRTFFCGAWAAPGVPLLESALRSAIQIAHHLNIAVPWDPIKAPPAFLKEAPLRASLASLR